MKIWAWKVQCEECRLHYQTSVPTVPVSIQEVGGGGVIVQHDVRTSYFYSSLMENVRVKRAGYAFRQVYPLFLYRYKMLAPETWPHWRGEAREGVQKILQNQEIPEEEYAFGTTKIFIRNPKLVSGNCFVVNVDLLVILDRILCLKFMNNYCVKYVFCHAG